MALLSPSPSISGTDAAEGGAPAGGGGDGYFLYLVNEGTGRGGSARTWLRPTQFQVAPCAYRMSAPPS